MTQRNEGGPVHPPKPYPYDPAVDGPIVPLVDPIASAKLDILKSICKLEGHRWIEVGSYSDMPFRRAMCGRGCGANRHELWSRSTVRIEQVAKLIADNGGTITSIEIVSEA